MNKTRIFEGKTVDVAIEAACDELKTSRDNLKYEIISYGSTGIFGIVGVKKAKIEVVLAPENEKAAPSENHTLKTGAKSLVDEAFSGKIMADDMDEDEIQTAASSDDDPYDGFEDDDEDMDTADANAINELSDEIIAKGLTALQKIADVITDEASINFIKEKNRLVYNIEGGEPSILIGKRGQTLEAIQYLIDKLINRSAETRVRVQVDVGGYLETRKKNLEGLALRLADKAKKTGKPSTIGQMTAHDRRIVHLALKDDNGVRTQSMGEGYYRRLVIFPKRNNSNGRKKRPVKRNA